MTKQALIIVGAGGHGKVVAEAAEAMGGYCIVAIVDDKFSSEHVNGGMLFAPLGEIESLLERFEGAQLLITVGSNSVRRQLDARLRLPNERFATVIHPTAIISPRAVIGSGSVVMPGAVVHTDAVIGRHVIVNTRSVVEHDCIVNDYAHISPAAALAGGVCVETGAQVGIGACVLPGIRIGAWSTLGAGATAIREVPANCTAVGVPASHISYRGSASRPALAQAD